MVGDEMRSAPGGSHDNHHEDDARDSFIDPKFSAIERRAEEQGPTTDLSFLEFHNIEETTTDNSDALATDRVVEEEMVTANYNNIEGVLHHNSVSLEEAKHSQEREQQHRIIRTQNFIDNYDPTGDYETSTGGGDGGSDFENTAFTELHFPQPARQGCQHCSTMGNADNRIPGVFDVSSPQEIPMDLGAVPAVCVFYMVLVVLQLISYNRSASGSTDTKEENSGFSEEVAVVYNTTAVPAPQVGKNRATENQEAADIQWLEAQLRRIRRLRREGNHEEYLQRVVQAVSGNEVHQVAHNAMAVPNPPAQEFRTRRRTGSMEGEDMPEAQRRRIEPMQESGIGVEIHLGGKEVETMNGRQGDDDLRNNFQNHFDGEDEENEDTKTEAVPMEIEDIRNGEVENVSAANCQDAHSDLQGPAQIAVGMGAFDSRNEGAVQEPADAIMTSASNNDGPRQVSPQRQPGQRLGNSFVPMLAGAAAMSEEQWNTITGLEKQPNTRFCGDLDKIREHYKSKVSTKHPVACYVCGENAYTQCGICKQSLHMGFGGGKFSSYTCWLDYHDSYCFGLCREDCSSPVAKKFWTPISNEQKRRRKEMIQAAADGTTTPSMGPPTAPES